jgi:hypothetical protein
MIQEVAGAPYRDISHSGNKSNVIRELTEEYRNAVGLIDEDPGSTPPPKIRRFTQEKQIPEYSYRLLYDESRNNRLVVLYPRLEEWILNTCRVNDVDVTRFRLPDNPSRLHNMINYRIPQFRSILEELNNTDHFNSLRTTFASNET